jgi:hypothetical protein
MGMRLGAGLGAPCLVTFPSMLIWLEIERGPLRVA